MVDEPQWEKEWEKEKANIVWLDVCVPIKKKKSSHL